MPVIRPESKVTTPHRGTPSPNPVCRRLACPSRVRRPGLSPVFATLLSCLAALSAPQTAKAADQTDDRPIEFGALGLATLETARLNVVNIGEPNVIPPGPCRVTLSYLDANGIIINDRNGRPFSAQLDVARGKILHFDMSSRSVNINGRLQFRALVTLPAVPGDGSVDQCANMIPSLEIFDQVTSRTLLVLHPALIRGFDPQPDPPGAPLLLQ
jgi:hypothetical protein